jgi:hypothetical protein
LAGGNFSRGGSVGVLVQEILECRQAHDLFTPPRMVSCFLDKFPPTRRAPYGVVAFLERIAPEEAQGRRW